MNSSRKIVFFGTPEQSGLILSSLIENGHEIVGVITAKDKRRSRGKTLYPTPVKRIALELGLNVYESELKSEIEEIVDKLVVEKKAEVGVVVAFGQILTKKVLDLFKFGCINVHYSLLPRWRGAAPVERAILSGDEKSGISIMKMDIGLDTGDVYINRDIAIGDSTTSNDLFEKMGTVSKMLLNDVLIELENIAPIPQEGESTYAKKLSKQDFEVNAKDSIAEVSRKVRAGAMLKGAYVNSSVGSFRIIEIGIFEEVLNDVVGLRIDRSGNLYSKDGVLPILKIQSENKAAMDFRQWANGVDKSKFDIEII